MPNPASIAGQIIGMMGRSMRFVHHGRSHDRRREITVHNVTVLDRASGRRVLVRIEGDIIEGQLLGGG